MLAPGRWLALAAGVFLAAITAMAVASFPLGLYAIFSDHRPEALGRSLEEMGIQVPVVVFGMLLPVSIPVPTGALFFFLWAVYLVFVAYQSLGPSRSVAVAVRRMLSGDARSLFESNLLTVMATFSVLFLGTLLLKAAQESLGVPTGSLEEGPLKGVDPKVVFTLISIAPITEEIGFRLMIIGAVAVVTAPGPRKITTILRVLARPEKGSDAAETGPGGSRQLILLSAVVLTSTAFGLAHVVGQTGWSVGKASLATLSGLGLGLIYVKRGILQAVLVHWCFNYLSMAYYVFGISTGLPLLLSLLDSLTLVSGVLSLGILLSAIRKKIVPDAHPSMESTEGEPIHESRPA